MPGESPAALLYLLQVLTPLSPGQDVSKYKQLYGRMTPDEQSDFRTWNDQFSALFYSYKLAPPISEEELGMNAAEKLHGMCNDCYGINGAMTGPFGPELCSLISALDEANREKFPFGHFHAVDKWMGIVRPEECESGNPHFPLSEAQKQSWRQMRKDSMLDVMDPEKQEKDKQKQNQRGFWVRRGNNWDYRHLAGGRGEGKKGRRP